MDNEFSKSLAEVGNELFETYEKIYSSLLQKSAEKNAVVHKRLKKVLDYNLENGKNIRGAIVVYFSKVFVPNKFVRHNKVDDDYIVGACVEIMQAFFIMYDDIMDQSTTRRGKKCWYLENNVGVMGFIDSLMLQMFVFETLENYLSMHDCYQEIVDLFITTMNKTVIGQCMDCKTTPNDGKTDHSLLTEERYATIVKWKGSFYTFALPAQLALHLAGIRNEVIHNHAQQIMLRIGYLFSVQDDFIDCFGDPDETGKIGTDIENGKCSWIAVQAVKRMSKEETEYFKKHFGVRNKNDARNIRLLYKKLKIEEVFFEFENREYYEIKKLIEKFHKSTGIEAKPFYEVLDFLYKRKK